MLYCKFKKASKELKNSKTPEVDSMPAKLLTVLGDKGKMKLFEICDKICH